MNDITEMVDELRVEADMLIQLGFQLNRKHQSQNNIDAIRSLKMTKCWLGKIKSVLGCITPYIEVTDKKKIPKTTQVFQEDLPVIVSRLNAVNELRRKIAEFASKASKLKIHENLATRFSLQDTVQFEAFKNNTSRNLAEARFFYGFELAGIRDNELQVNSNDL